MTNEEIFLKEGVGKANFIYAMAIFLFNNLGNYTGTQGNIIDTMEEFFGQKAKPTLTEDERVILEFIKNFDYIGRDKKGLYYKLQDEDIKEKTAVIYNFTTNLFQFIKEGEEYSIEELLKDEL